jgi:hypothetical protein
MSSFKRNPNFQAELAVELTGTVLRRAGNEVAAAADSLAHSAMPRKGRKRMVVQRVDGEVVVANTNHGGHLEEFGSQNNPAYGPLRRGVLAAGLDLRES